MRRLSTPAAKRLAPLSFAFAALISGFTPAHAQASDPFALPRDVTIANARSGEAQGPGLSAIAIDGRSLVRMVELAYVNGELAIDAKSAEMANLPVDPAATGLIRLKDLKIAKWSFDKLSQRLSITLLRDKDGANDVNLARFQRSGGGERSPIPALLVNYDLSTTINKTGVQSAAVISPRAVYGNFQADGSVQYISQPAPGERHLRRLDTTVTFAMPDKGLIARAGDTITAGTQSQRPLRIGGLQFGTDFALRPDLVTNPLPAFEGSVAVPTGLDLIINDRRFTTAELEAGEFQVRNIPVSPGRGEVSVIVKDELGREVVQNARIYVSTDLLAPGLWEGAANLGYIRRRFGQVSNDYRDLVGTFFLRRGFSKSLSFGVSGEVGLGLKNFGAQVETTVFDRALVFSEVRYSETAQNSGFLLRAGVESVGETFSIRADAVIPSTGYRDLAAQAGDPAPTRQVNASINFNLRDTMRLQLTASQQKRHFDPRFPRQTRKLNLLRATFRTAITDSIDFTSDVSYRQTERSSIAIMAGVSVQLGKKRSAQASISRSSGRNSAQASFFRPDSEPGQIGYGVQALAAERSRVAVNTSWRSRYTRLEGLAEYNGGQLAARANARGTVIFTGGTFYARNQTGGSYALVETGKVPGITVMRENREAGVTDSRGRLLVESLTPLVPLQFDIDPDKLPFDAVARSTYRRVIVPRGGVALVKLDVEAYRSQLIKLVDALGRPLETGTRLVAQPSGTEYMVGYDGLLDFNILSGDKNFSINQPGREPCAMPVPAGDIESFDIPEGRASCIGLNIAQADIDGAGE